MLPRRPEASAQTDFRPRAMHTSPRGGERRFPLGSRLLTTAVSSYQPRTRSSKRAVFSKNTASVLADWKSPNKESPHRHGDAQRGVSDPRMRRSSPSFRFSTRTFEAAATLRPRGSSVVRAGMPRHRACRARHSCHGHPFPHRGSYAIQTSFRKPGPPAVLIFLKRLLFSRAFFAISVSLAQFWN
jgi:hypothetical protein